MMTIIIGMIHSFKRSLACITVSVFCKIMQKRLTACYSLPLSSDSPQWDGHKDRPQ